MRAVLAFAASLALCAAAQAQTALSAAPEPTVGVGMICNTSDQARQLVDLQSHGAKAEQAMDAVNAQAKNARACGIAAVAFVPDQTLATTPVNNKLLRVMRIQIVAGFDGRNWRQTAVTQYAIVEDIGGLSI